MKRFFDDFTYHACVMPVIVLFFPILIISVFNGIAQDGWFNSILTSSICFIFLSVSSKISRNLGKQYEKKMYEELGGMPTTIVQRFSDSTFDDITKQRYHKKLNQFKELSLPKNKSTETANSDYQYASAANILRNYANSNRDKEYRVYQELKEYNFWRNLYGSKRIALGLYLILAIRELLAKNTFSLVDAFLHPYPDYIVPIVLMLCIAFVLLCVNKQTVKQKAFDYAKALIEVCERIPTNSNTET